MLAVSTAAESRGDDKFDVIIRQGRIVDGTGAPWYIADVAIDNGRIVGIGRFAEDQGERVIDATGLVVSPGFIDMMGQTGEPFLDHPETALNLLTQGVTTINAGEGHSPAPVEPRDFDDRRWRTLAEYFLLLEQAGLPVNVAQTVGHTEVRRVVLGEIDRRPTADELQQMQQYVRTAMEDGAIGLSTALIYPPATYATTEEIASLAEVVGESGGRYYTHMRNEGDRLLEAIDEALEIGRTGGVPVHIFHLKAAGRQNWSKIDEAIARIRAALGAAGDGRHLSTGNGLGSRRSFIRRSTEGRIAVRRLGDPEVRTRIRGGSRTRTAGRTGSATSASTGTKSRWGASAQTSTASTTGRRSPRSPRRPAKTRGTCSSPSPGKGRSPCRRACRKRT